MIVMVFLDLLLLTKLNVIRLYPLFPANFYFSYGSIFVYASISFLMLIASNYTSRMSVLYVFFVIYAFLIGIWHENPNALADVRYWLLGIFCLHLFSKPAVMQAIINFPNWLLHIVLATEVMVAMLLIAVPGMLGFVGYGMGVPAYLTAFYLARDKYMFAAVSILLTFIQNKRGYSLAVLCLVLVYLFKKSRLLFLTVLAFTIAFIFIWLDIENLFLVMKYLRTEQLFDSDILDTLIMLSGGRFAEIENTLLLFEGPDWLTGLGLGFEFDRMRWSEEIVVAGYTHITPYNFYLTGGVIGILLMGTCCYLSFRNSLRVKREHNVSEPLYISVVALVACFFSFWSAVSPLFWLFIAFGTMVAYRRTAAQSPLSPLGRPEPAN